MQTSLDEIFAPIYQKYGQRWNPENMENIDDEYCPARFALGLQKYIEGVFQGEPLRKRCKNLEVTFRYIENQSINALAWKVSPSKEEYLVAIFAGAILKLKDLYFSDIFIWGLQPTSKHLLRLKDKDLARYALYFGSMFLAFHELGHVYRGHLNYFKPGASNGSFMWDELMELSANAADSSSPNRRHLSECDADAFSGTLLAGEIVIHSTNVAKTPDFLGIPKKELARDLLTLATTAIHLVFCIFDQKDTPDDGDYPCPPIRSAILHGHLMAQLASENFEESIITASGVSALSQAEMLADQLGLKKSTDNLGNTFEAWEAKYSVALSGLTQALIPFAPCNR